MCSCVYLAFCLLIITDDCYHCRSLLYNTIFCFEQTHCACVACDSEWVTIFFHLHENWFYYLILLYQSPLDSAGLQSSTWMSWWSRTTWKHWLQITWGPCRWLLLTWMASSTSTLRSVSRQHHVLWMELVTSHTTGAILYFCQQMFLIFRSLGVCVFSCNLLPALSAQDQDIFTCYLANTGVERILSQHGKLTLEKKTPAASPGTWTCDLSVTSPQS